MLKSLKLRLLLKDLSKFIILIRVDKNKEQLEYLKLTKYYLILTLKNSMIPDPI